MSLPPKAQAQANRRGHFSRIRLPVGRTQLRAGRGVPSECLRVELPAGNPPTPHASRATQRYAARTRAPCRLCRGRTQACPGNARKAARQSSTIGGTPCRTCVPYTCNARAMHMQYCVYIRCICNARAMHVQCACYVHGMPMLCICNAQAMHPLCASTHMLSICYAHAVHMLRTFNERA